MCHFWHLFFSYLNTAYFHNLQLELNWLYSNLEMFFPFHVTYITLSDSSTIVLKVLLVIGLQRLSNIKKIVFQCYFSFCSNVITMTSRLLIFLSRLFCKSLDLAYSPNEENPKCFWAYDDFRLLDKYACCKTRYDMKTNIFLWFLR